MSVSAIRAMMGSLGMGRSDAEVQNVLAELSSTQETEFGRKIAGLKV